MTPSVESIAPNPHVRNPELTAKPNEKIAVEPKGCAGCGTPEKAFTAPKPNVGHGYDGPVYCLSCNPRFFRAGVASLAGRL